MKKLLLWISDWLRDTSPLRSDILSLRDYDWMTGFPSWSLDRTYISRLHPVNTFLLVLGISQPRNIVLFKTSAFF
jgi:hypothetical protein